ncbi:hypothetical protein BX661DRAFT_198815 [Kickxella alabastrina]|uniref:uncharacterized protein n=1 Tax=Kickxella alabastrina TaxID=61397 RepID=UPI00222048B6|nr:uncharacterized protein BX661DRAFT_198815 [Kickxella alabastrina]KAI7826804.1 hypothetical protein BX661DRAFT_198815 [Kickxella alabastrina]
MSHSITSARYAHAEGYTAVAFNRSGQFLCTGGSDSLVRVFKTGKNERDQEAITMEQHSDSVLSLAVSRGKIITGDDEGLVLSFDTGSSDMLSEQGSSLSVQPSGTVLRSTLPARDISISNSERQVAIATDDENVRVVSLLDTSLLHTLVGHRGSVISVAYSPDAAFLASSGCDGTARVWDMRDGEPTAFKSLPSMEQYKVRWSPDGRMFAIPGADNSIKLVERNTWEPSVSLGGKHTKMITSVSWSSNSRYLASVGLDCQVVVWDHGALRFWDDVVPVKQGHAPPFDTLPLETSSLHRDYRQAGTAHTATNDLMSDLFNDAADIENMVRDFGMSDSGNAMTGGGADDDDDDNDDIMDGGEATGDGLDDFVVDDDGAGYAERQEPRWMAVGDPTTHCFQPGSTPWIGDRRYLAFNMVGSIVSIAQDDAHNTIEVEFYDKSMHRDFHFSDSFKFSMAALSESGCLLATTSRELANDQSLRGALDADEASVISYRGLASWSSNSDWMFRMPAKEHPRCIATSAHGAAVITSLGMLRLFTCGGVQRHIESLPNRVVTCTAHGDMLLIVMEGLGTIKSSTGSRRLEYEYVLMSMDGQSRLAAGFCPVAPASEIVWAGFSEEGHPATGDSKGMVRVLHKYWAAMTRLVGPREARAYWPVALSAKQLIAPILDEIDVEIPLLQSDSHTAQQEAKYLSTSVFYEQQCGEAERTGSEYPGGKASQARDALEQDKLLLRLIAVHQKQSLLAERLMRLKESKFSSNADDDDEVEEEEDVDMESDGQKGFRSSTAVAAAAAAATYGRGKQSDSEDSVGGDEDDVFGMAAPGADVGLTIARPPRSLLQQAEGLAAAAALAPTTSKPFNPFGVVSPSKSMEIKRSDSFFNAADAHSSALSREASAANLGGGSLTTTTKRQNQLVADDDDGSAGPRKLAKKAAAAAAADSSSGTKDRAQSKLFAFAFKRDDSKSGATSALPKPMAAAAGASENGDCNGNEDIISDVNCDGDDAAFAD